MTSAATAASPPRSAVELHQELALEAMEAKIAGLAQETKAFLARESSLPEVPKFQGRTSKARQTFEHFDADGSGTIDYKEVEVGPVSYTHLTLPTKA